MNNTTTQSITALKDSGIIQRFIELVSAPITNSNMMWIVTPLLVSLIVMQLYFGMYRKEKLSWDSATGNALALAFVAADLLRHLFRTIPGLTIWSLIIDHFPKFILISLVAFASLWLMIGDFFHLLPEKIAMTISSSLPINLMAYVCITVIYSNLAIDLNMIIAAIMLFISLWIIFRIIWFFEPISLPKKQHKR